jgi:NADP-dependent aldehyde dehydrogenase
MLIGSISRRGTGPLFHALDAERGEAIEPSFASATEADIAEACAMASTAFDPYRETDLEKRALFLETIADNILGLGDELIERCVIESGLSRGRIIGERDRTIGQMRFFANVVRDRSFLGIRIDRAVPDRTPLPRPDMRLRHIALGPVVVFGASNFPLAFSVAGGDTASALAAGCPVIVKAHPAHPGTSELVGRAIQDAVKTHDLPAGTFSLLFDNGLNIGLALVSDPRIKAVGFTGSQRGGTALMAIAAARPEPIPVYAEMSAINPVVLFESALAARGAKIGQAFVASLALGAGQFCTNPGMVIGIASKGLDAFMTAAIDAINAAPAATMLTPGIHNLYCEGVARLARHKQVTQIARGKPGERFQGQVSLFKTDAAAFLADPTLHEEVFGASSLIVICQDENELNRSIDQLDGQLSVSLHLDAADQALAARLLPHLEKKAGRLIVNGFATGVEVAHAMVHGGPYPATSDGRSTSVGSLAIARFLRPVCYQDFPAVLLPRMLGDVFPRP